MKFYIRKGNFTKRVCELTFKIYIIENDKSSLFRWDVRLKFAIDTIYTFLLHH